jgi:type I restriction enzyme R subunit
VAVHQEHAFEASIELDMLAAGWVAGSPADYDRELAVDIVQMLAFLKATQPKEVEQLAKVYGAVVDMRIVARVASEIDSRGTLDVLRNGVKDRGVALRLAYFEPPTSVNEVLMDRYRANVLSVTRQLAYESSGGKELDLALFVNGIPTATVELKNPLSGQNVQHAIHQYKYDRSPKGTIFARRALAHFAVDPYRVYLTTKLTGASTRFLPFNLGTNGPGVDGGEGNPANPNGYDTDYLWKQAWAPRTWLDLLQRFVHVEGAKSKATTIFPRFHQWHAVHEIARDVATRGAGTNYLVQHSAGSGKSNTIAWLAHRLSKQHTTSDASALSGDAAGLGPEQKVFDKVIVITDRRVLDKQLQDTIFQFEHVPGVVQKIDENSQQLADALTGTTAQVIITTLQKFPFVVSKIGPLSERRYAVIIDEAHSSSSGEGQTKLKEVLTFGGNADAALAAAEASDAADEVATENADLLGLSAASRGRHGNLSFFAFTATPKHKTLELFGTPGVDSDGKPANLPFHVYSMRQAIDEGFIFDVLANYVTYSTYYRVNKEAADVAGSADKKKAAVALARFASLHPTNLAQRAEIIVNHYAAHVQHRMGGRAKAMVVTRSRLHALRLHQAITAYIAANNLGLHSLVAFSGSLTDDTGTYTEANVNGMVETKLPAAFAYTLADGTPASEKLEYALLVVADKYQTGFDQPLLSAMYVDKKLASVAAVQTLSRLNRTHPLKSQDDVFVLDFANSADEIQESFRPFFATTLGEPADPNRLYAMQTQLMGYQILRDDEMDAYAIAFLGVKDSAEQVQAKAQAVLYPLLGPARGRFQSLLTADRPSAEAFLKVLTQFERQYAFLAQVIAYIDTDLERLYLFGKFLRRTLIDLLGGGPQQGIDLGDIALTHLRVTEAGSHILSLGDDAGPVVVPGPAGDGTGSDQEPAIEPWDVIIREFNERFGTEWSNNDLVRAMIEEEMRDTNTRDLALNNTPANFELAYGDRGPSRAIEKHSDNEAFLGAIFKNEETKLAFSKLFARGLYTAIREELDEAG